VAEILIQWGDKVSSLDPLYHHNYKDGDVIAICDNGWAWSNRELTNPSWRIIQLPNITKNELGTLVQTVSEEGTNKFLRKRSRGIQRSILPNPVKNQILNNQVSTFNNTFAELSAWIADHP